MTLANESCSHSWVSIDSLEPKSTLQLTADADVTEGAVRDGGQLCHEAPGARGVVQGSQADGPQSADLKVHIARVVVPMEIEQVSEASGLE